MELFRSSHRELSINAMIRHDMWYCVVLGIGMFVN